MAEVAVGKRIRINKMQQQIILAVLAASLVLGVAIVFCVFFIKYIAFNTKVIDAKDKAISNYYSAISNVGLCKDTDGDKKFTDKELDKCDPNSIDVADIPGTLRYNVLVGMAENHDLESVARGTLDSCYKSGTKEKIDFSKAYQEAKTDEERANQFYMLKACSSLRAVPDALPAQKNVEALLASINQLFQVSGKDPESLAPNTTSEVSPVQGLEVIPVSLTVEDTVKETTTILENIEKSIRMLDIETAKLTWSGETAGSSKLELSASALAFYTNEVNASETKETIYASKDAKKAGGSSASTTDTSSSSSTKESK